MGGGKGTRQFLVTDEQQESVPVARGVVFMGAKLKPIVSVNIEAGGDPALRRCCEADIVGLDQGAVGDVDEPMSQHVFFQQHLAVATFDGGRGQINFQVPFEQGQTSPNNSVPIVEIDFNGTATFLGATAVAPGIFTLADRPTTRKTRVVAHNQQVVRADWESTAPPPDDDRGRIAAFVRRRAADCDAVILSDYAKGLLCREIVEATSICPLVLADPKPQNVELLRGVTCVAPNVAEASTMTGISIVDDASLERAGVRLLEMLDCRYAVITRGEHGMALFGRNGQRLRIPSVARTVYDVSGAGDTVIAVLALALAAGAAIEQAMQLANFAAGVVVEKLGTATASPEEIVALVEPATGPG